MSGSTPLQRLLADGGAARRATPLDALELSRRWFHEGRRLDIQALAAALGVSRVTLHRWVGTREQLLVEVLWQTADIALTRLRHRVEGEGGPESVTARVLARWASDVVDHPGIRQMQADDADMLARILTHDGSSFQRRLVERVAELLTADFDAGRLTIDLGVADLAYATVRIAESFVHTPAITGAAPDPAANARVLHALLR